MDTAIGAVGLVLGAVVAILLTILVENTRKPKLKIALDSPIDVPYQGQARPAQQARYVRLNLINEPLPRWTRWMSRNVALQCHGSITFHRLDGQDVFGRAMAIRWSGSREPVLPFIAIGSRQFPIFDLERLTPQLNRDVSPGEHETLDVVASFDNDSECYGWSNESYFSNPLWRNPNWRLPSGRYLVKVVIVSAGERLTDVFRLINDVPVSDFRIERAMPSDPVPS
jgi:hypothetical protein